MSSDERSKENISNGSQIKIKKIVYEDASNYLQNPSLNQRCMMESSKCRILLLHIINKLYGF
jgi:hypothetical protein